MSPQVIATPGWVMVPCIFIDYHGATPTKNHAKGSYNFSDVFFHSIFFSKIQSFLFLFTPVKFYYTSYIFSVIFLRLREECTLICVEQKQ